MVSLTVPDSASVLSLVKPPLEIVVVKPVFVPIVLLIASVGAVVSSVKLSVAVPGLPKLSVWLATMVCGPSASPLGVNDHAPWASAVTVATIGLPSIVKCTTVLARPVPVNASFEVMRSIADDPVSIVRLSVTVGPAAVMKMPVAPSPVAWKVALPRLAVWKSRLAPGWRCSTPAARPSRRCS